MATQGPRWGESSIPETFAPGFPALGRVRLSQSFFMRDFLYREIAAWHGLRNVRDHPEQAVAVGKMLCEHLLQCDSQRASSPGDARSASSQLGMPRFVVSTDTPGADAS